MRSYRTLSLLPLAVLACVVGCMPRVDVTPNPGYNTKGIRYYRPKPYLLITPYATTTTTSTTVEQTEPTPASVKNEVKVGELSDQFVQIELQYLPDFSEEYAINIRTGFGTNNTEITLEDGWNLTRLNTELDSQTDENVKAVADLISSVGSVVPKGFAPSAAGLPAETKKTVVCATNVPLGYYESVIGRDRCGRKQLQGWRYVGFAPFNGCPLNMCGSQAATCDSVELYGLAFENGVMTFKSLYKLDVIEEAATTLKTQSAGACPEAEVTTSTAKESVPGATWEEMPTLERDSLPPRAAVRN